MKKQFIVLLVSVMVMFSSIAFAEEVAKGKTALDNQHIIVKIDQISFTSSTLRGYGIDEDYFIGIEYAQETTRNTLLCLEIGYANPSGDYRNLQGNVSMDTTFIPLELNFKYLFDLENIVIDIGGGLSLNHVREKRSGAINTTHDDWLFGVQFFSDINYVFGDFFAGANVKGTLTEDVKGFNHSYDNWRMGLQAGMMF